MRKIIAAFDGLRFSESTLEYALWLGKHHDAHIVGVFLSENTKLGFAAYELLVGQTVSGAELAEDLEKSDQATVHESISKFELACSEAGINYSIHKDNADATEELLHETHFADLLLIDSQETFSYLDARLPAGFIRQMLQEAHCPIMVVPKEFRPIQRLALLYDGQASSVYAIKMLAYILPKMSLLETKLFHAHEAAPSMGIPDNQLMQEWGRHHFPNIEYKLIKGKERELVAGIAVEDPGILIVTGAYHRGSLSMWLHGSLADLLINEIKSPLFIAHV